MYERSIPYLYPLNQQTNQQVIPAIYNEITKEALVIILYNDLLKLAPIQHKHSILYAIARKKSHLNQFTNLYIHLTGQFPTYQTNKVPFQSYEEGLEVAYIKGKESCREYQNIFISNPIPHVQRIFQWACCSEKENTTQFHILREQTKIPLKDYGPKPYVVNIEKATTQNDTYRTALWTGEHFQATLMSIGVGNDIGLEVHPNTDQFIRIEQGKGLVQMGNSKNNLTFEEKAEDDFAIFVPAGKWHNVTNIGDDPLKVYVIYAPPHHPFGTVQKTRPEVKISRESYGR